jgi:hypothetical protein
MDRRLARRVRVLDCSTSFLNRAVLAHRVDVFETDLRGRLLACCGRGVFEQDVSVAYELARRTT